MAIKITSDSTCDLSPELLSAHDISIIPLNIVKDGVSLRDTLDITPADIFAHVAAGGALCSTAAVNVVDYSTRFAQLSEEYDAVIHINIGAEFSSCFQNATLAAREFKNVYAVDSRNLSTAQGLVVMAAVEMAEAGVGAAEIVRRLNGMLEKIDGSFILDRLDYLRNGGRCSSVTALGANLLKLKPCIELDNGRMHVGRKYRGAYEKCVREYISSRLSAAEPDTHRIFLVHTPVSEEVLRIARQTIKECANFEEIIETTAGCTISCHCGPGTLGVMFMKK